MIFGMFGTPFEVHFATIPILHMNDRFIPIIKCRKRYGFRKGIQTR